MSAANSSPIDRRTFLQDSTALAAALTLPAHVWTAPPDLAPIPAN
jgi:hypothetical protein